MSRNGKQPVVVDEHVHVDGDPPCQGCGYLVRPPVIEGPGRYVVYQAPDGGWVVARAVGICETCQSCGCGEQAEPIAIPAMVISLAGNKGFSLSKLKDMTKAFGGR